MSTEDVRPEADPFLCLETWWSFGRVEHGCELRRGHDGLHRCCCGECNDGEAGG